MRNIHIYNTELDYWLSPDEIDCIVVVNEKMPDIQVYETPHEHTRVYLRNGRILRTPFRLRIIKEAIESSGDTDAFIMTRSRITRRTSE